ncbi:MAG: hypothetical protein ABIZ04_20770 [Opitutus sp.]
MKTQSLTVALAVGLSVIGANQLQAASLDLTAASASGSLNGAYFTNTDIGATGTGLIKPFVRLQDIGVADGYNSNSATLMPDVKAGTWTHDITLAEIPIVVNPGSATGSYYEFLLDINQTGANSLLSLDSIMIYTRPTALTSAGTIADLTAAPSVLRYNLDGNAANEILLNYALNSGSGSGDLFAYINVNNFAGAAGTDYLYFYSMFGNKGGDYADNDGFEEWAVRSVSPTKVPESGTSALLVGLGLIAIGVARHNASRIRL